MSLANPFQFLIDFYFFEDKYYCTEDILTCTSYISGQTYRVQKTDNDGFRVDLKSHHNGKAIWEMQMAVANIQSTLGVVDDCEERWRKQQKKKAKDNKTCEAG